jgi:hypothetical protein
MERGEERYPILSVFNWQNNLILEIVGALKRQFYFKVPIVQRWHFEALYGSL